MTYPAPSLLLSDFSSCPFAVFFPLGKGVMEIRSGGVMKARGAAYAASAKSLPGINSAFLMPMPRYSPGSITPIFSEGSQRRKNRHAKGKRKIVKGDL